MDRDSIEREISRFNTKYLQKAHNSVVYKDKIYKLLWNDKVRDKVLNE